MNELEKALLSAPDFLSPTCPFCGKQSTEKHHVIFRSQGGKDSPLVSVCGFGNTSGCHGKLHKRLLHLRFTDRWEFLETKEPTKYQTALSMDGWLDLKENQRELLRDRYEDWSGDELLAF